MTERVQKNSSYLNGKSTVGTSTRVKDTTSENSLKTSEGRLWQDADRSAVGGQKPSQTWKQSITIPGPGKALGGVNDGS